jgi:hypothetical protein
VIDDSSRGRGTVSGMRRGISMCSDIEIKLASMYEINWFVVGRDETMAAARSGS